MTNETTTDDITESILLDQTTRMLLAAWVDHQSQEVPADDYAIHIDHVRALRDEWVRKDQAWRAVISARLLRTALEAVTE